MLVLTDSTEIRASPERVFHWFKSLKSKTDYQRWHPDHVDVIWTKGEPFEEGSIARFKEYLHGQLYTFTFLCTRVVPDRTIEYKPLFPWSVVMSRGSFVFEPKGEDSCTFTATISLRLGPLCQKLFRRRLEAVRQHMREEGEILKRLLESNGK